MLGLALSFCTQGSYSDPPSIHQKSLEDLQTWAIKCNLTHILILKENIRRYKIKIVRTDVYLLKNLKCVYGRISERDPPCL